jgi:predicted transcriptional regulator
MYISKAVREIKGGDLSTILKKTCDEKSLTLFENIALSDGDGYISLKEMNLTVKQYYSRLSGLMESGLVKRQKGKYSLTILGKIVRDAFAVIGQALSLYWKINALESIESSIDGLPRQELLKLIDTLITNQKIKEIVTKTLLESKDSSSSPNHQIKTQLEMRDLMTP